MTEIHGNTYPHRAALAAMGGRWNAAKKCWMVPADKAAQAQALVGTAKKGGAGRAPRQCATCGCRINYGVYCGKCEFAR
jgi:hypothetical protein